MPISWREDKFDLIDYGSIQVNGGVRGITPSRWINWVYLRQKSTGKMFTRINTHVVHHYEVAGRPRVHGRISGQNMRAKHHIAMLREAIVDHAKTGPVITGGDLNADYRAEKRLAPSKRCAWFPLTMLSPVAHIAMSNHGTHGGRAIDWTLLNHVHEVSQTILPHGSSDHNPVLTVVEL